jgi:type I restriction enzyme M protein
MFEQTFKNIEDILHKDAGCGSELDYVEQTSWILFLKYLDDLERDRATASHGRWSIVHGSFAECAIYRGG